MNTRTVTVLGRQVSERTARLFAADCAVHVLHVLEQRFPDDPRPRQAIETARAFALGTASKEDLEQACRNAATTATAATTTITAADAAATADAYGRRSVFRTRTPLPQAYVLPMAQAFSPARHPSLNCHAAGRERGCGPAHDGPHRK